MITENPEYEQFIADHRWAVLTSLRATGAPVSSVVAYATDGDTLVVSTPGGTFKRQSLERDARASLCILSNAEPFDFVSVEGQVTVETDDLEPGTRKVFANIAGTGFPEPADLAGWLQRQQRVLLRLCPERCYGVIRQGDVHDDSSQTGE